MRGGTQGWPSRQAQAEEPATATGWEDSAKCSPEVLPTKKAYGLFSL
jgi:hypothetical protein